MTELISYTWYYFVQAFGLIIAFAAAAVLLYLVLRHNRSRAATLALVIAFLGVSIFFYVPNGLPDASSFPLGLRTFGPSGGPVLPFSNVVAFFGRFGSFERVANIAHDPNDIPPAANPSGTESREVNVELTVKEVIAEMAPGITFNYWTFNGTVPGPFIRVREGDMVNLTLTNDPTSLHMHNIDLHAVNGPGGGAAATNVMPGESKTFRFKAMNPGIYVYHCAHPNVPSHMTHGLYGLILVEPYEGLPPVDKEFYVMQGEFYSVGSLGQKGLQLFDAQAMLDGKPQYVVFNGKTGALVENMNADVGDRVRMYVGNGGVNLVSSFHVIGEIFDRVYREGDLSSPPAKNVQTTLVPAGGATMVEFTVNYPGKYPLVDHALARMDRGAWGVLTVTGKADAGIFDGVIESGGGH
jgi:nitrite reductase (NO-forming)